MRAVVSSSTLGLGVVLVTVLLGVLLLRNNGLLPGGQSSQYPEASDVAETSPAGTEPAVESGLPSTVPESSPSSAPSAVPEASITGDVPGPDATVPPGVPVIPGLRIEALVGLWESVGLTCKSSAGSFPGSRGGYHVYCERMDKQSNVEYVAESVYWTSDGVQTITLSITSINDEAIDGAAPARELLLPSAGLVAGDTARVWVQDRMSTATCRGGCTNDMGGSQLYFEVGRLGTHVLQVDAQ